MRSIRLTLVLFALSSSACANCDKANGPAPAASSTTATVATNGPTATARSRNVALSPLMQVLQADGGGADP